jgi:putative transcriptional regulator
MANHPNRSKFRHPAQRPDPATIEAARKAQRMTRKQAADVVYGTEAAWKSWEQGDRPMHAGLWELFNIKTLDREVLRALGLQRQYQPPEVGFTLEGVMVSSEAKP